MRVRLTGRATSGWGARLAALTVAIFAGLFANSASPPSADADAGTIASATPVVYGQQEFGNTLNGGVGESKCGSSSDHSYRSWWGLSVTSGDEVKIDWETHQTSMNMNLFAVGTTDYTFLKSAALITQEVNANFKEQATYTAVQTGILPFEFHSDSGCNSQPGPYNFIASVLHAVVLSLPVVAHLPPTGTITVGVHNPDGAPINDPSLVVDFDIVVSGSPLGVGSAPVVNGVATVPFSIPSNDAGHSVTIEATSTGSAYLPGSSSTEVVGIAKPVAPPICVVPAVRDNESLSRMEAAIRRAHCAVGGIHRVRSRHHRRGTVVAVSPRSSSHLPANTRVSITVSRGR